MSCLGRIQSIINLFWVRLLCVKHVPKTCGPNIETSTTSSMFQMVRKISMDDIIRFYKSVPWLPRWIAKKSCAFSAPLFYIIQQQRRGGLDSDDATNLRVPPAWDSRRQFDGGFQLPKKVKIDGLDGTDTHFWKVFVVQKEIQYICRTPVPNLLYFSNTVAYSTKVLRGIKQFPNLFWQKFCWFNLSSFIGKPLRS